MGEGSMQFFLGGKERDLTKVCYKVNYTILMNKLLSLDISNYCILLIYFIMVYVYLKKCLIIY